MLLSDAFISLSSKDTNKKCLAYLLVKSQPPPSIEKFYYTNLRHSPQTSRATPNHQPSPTHTPPLLYDPLQKNNNTNTHW